MGGCPSAQTGIARVGAKITRLCPYLTFFTKGMISVTTYVRSKLMFKYNEITWMK
jgi:hypothetical protein